MARTGKQNWLKYWKGNEGITTSVKKYSSYYDSLTATKSLGYLTVGTQITYRDSLSQHVDRGGSTKIAFQLSNNPNDPVYYAPIDIFVKPGRVGGIDLKPEAFGIENETFANSAVYYNRVINAILDKWDSNTYSGELYDYLMELVDFANGGAGSFSGIKTEGFPWGSIQSYFAEVIGPLACIKRNLLNSLGISISSASIFMPPSSVSLYDYKLKSGNQEYLISAKSGKGVANQVKPQFVIAAVENTLSATLKSSDAYRLLEILKDNSVILGAFYGWRLLQSNGEITDACINDIITNYTSGPRSTTKLVDPGIWQSFISRHLPSQSNNTKNVTYGQLRYRCEKLIQDASKLGDLNRDLKNIFKNYLNSSRVIYVKMSLTMPMGTPSFSVMNDGGVKNINHLELRSSNDSISRTSDKIGFDRIR